MKKTNKEIRENKKQRNLLSKFNLIPKKSPRLVFLLAGAMSFLLILTVVMAAQSTTIGLQGTATDSGGSPVDNGKLEVNISSTSSCDGAVYSKIFNNVVQDGIFNVTLGEGTSLDLDYNQDYYSCLTIDSGDTLGPSIFRGGQGEVSKEDVSMEIYHDSVDSNLLLYIPFSEGSGATSSDKTKHSNDGTITSATWNFSGKFGNALSFDGSDDYVSLGTCNPGNLCEQNITESVWIKIPQEVSIEQHIINHGGRNDIGIELGSITCTNGEICARSYTGSFNGLQSGVILKPDKWYHIVFVTKQGEGHYLYVNGQLKASDSVTSDISYEINRDRRLGSTWNDQKYFDGLIDEVKIYNKSLNAEDVMRLYKTGLGTQGIYMDSSTGNVNITNNLTIGEKLTFKSVEIIDNLIDGFIQITGNLSLNGENIFLSSQETYITSEFDGAYSLLAYTSTGASVEETNFVLLPDTDDDAFMDVSDSDGAKGGRFAWFDDKNQPAIFPIGSNVNDLIFGDYKGDNNFIPSNGSSMGTGHNLGNSSNDWLNIYSKNGTFGGDVSIGNILSYNNGITFTPSAGDILDFDNSNANGLLRFTLASNRITLDAFTAPMSLQQTAGADIEMFGGSTEGETQEILLEGFRSGDAARQLEMGVGVDADDTASFDGVSNYWFDGDIQAEDILSITPKATAPATCSIGDFYTDTSGAACHCSSTNSWENIGSTGSCA